MGSFQELRSKALGSRDVEPERCVQKEEFLVGIIKKINRTLGLRIKESQTDNKTLKPKKRKDERSGGDACI